MSGIEVARSNRPDLIILDVMMPDVDGLETYRRLQNDSGTETISVIFLTAVLSKSEEENLIRSIGSPYVQILAKPFDANELKEKIRNSLSNR